MTSTDTLLKLLLIAVIAVVVLPLVMMLVMMPAMGMWGGGYMWNGGMVDGTGATWMWGLMWLVPLIIVVGLGYLLYRVLRSSDQGESDPALGELRAAYARGDLSDDEYERRRERLENEP